jgi:hypothetical protein
MKVPEERVFGPEKTEITKLWSFVEKHPISWFKITEDLLKHINVFVWKYDKTTMNLNSFVNHMKRITIANLETPIVCVGKEGDEINFDRNIKIDEFLTPLKLLDGYHRIAKAAYYGIEFIQCIWISEEDYQNIVKM